MTEVVELQSQIGNATREIEKSYKKALKSIEKLKEKINELELSISQKGNAEKSDIDELNSEKENLNTISDSLILKSERNWEEYKKLKHACKVCAVEPAGLDDLRLQCKKSEELATDLLCYSLARFKRKGV